MTSSVSQVALYLPSVRPRSGGETGAQSLGDHSLRFRLFPRHVVETGRWWTIHRSRAASTPTIRPIIKCAYVAPATVAKPINQGARIAQTPRARFTHYSLKAKRAPSAMSAIAAPTIKAFQVAATSPVKPSAQGASARQTPSTAFTRSMAFSLVSRVLMMSNMSILRGRQSPLELRQPPLRGCRHYEFGWA
jgi:hypothetical protein